MQMLMFLMVVSLFTDIYASLPLSLIQQDKNLRSQFQEELFSFAQSASQSPTFSYSAASLYEGGEEFPGVKQEEEEDISPPDSPLNSWGQGPVKPTRAQLASRLLNELDQCKEGRNKSVVLFLHVMVLHLSFAHIKISHKMNILTIYLTSTFITNS